MPKTQANLKAQLNTEGYKLTPQRKAILDILIKQRCKHLKCDEIYQLVRSKMPSIGIATVYRTLPLLEKMGFLNRILLDDGLVRYEVSTQGENHSHHHMICTGCGELSEIEVDMLDDLEKQIQKTTGFLVQNHSLRFYGLCQKCQGKLNT
ncbi:MAG: transcriptional repressor [Clostridia bacterium]|nr:transcriptional repressor [Clostridia bacterium]